MFQTSREPVENGPVLSVKKQRLVLGLALLVTAAVYVPHLSKTFLEWDLVAYREILYTTDYLQTTIRLFTDFQGKVVTGYYAPLASVSLMLDKWIIGAKVPSAWFTLLVNLLIHCLNGLLVFRLLRAVGADPETATLAAFIFLIHPVQVSSVLWFSQRKGLLATGLYLGAYLLYLKHTETSSSPWYAASLGIFSVALLTKPTVVFFPVALLAWRVLYVHTRESGLSVAGSTPSSIHSNLRELALSYCRDVWVLFPVFLLALGSGLLAMESERASMEVEVPPDLPLTDRPVIAGASICFYLAKILMPVNLTPVYHKWTVDVGQISWWLPLIGLLAAAVLVVRYRKRIGVFPVWCILNFLIPLLPVVGLMKFGYLRLSYVADHFLYLPMVGMAGLLAGSLTGMWRHFRPPVRQGVALVGCLYLLFCLIQTSFYASVWRDSVTLWTHNLSQDPSSWTAHNYLGHALLNSGRPEDSIERFQETLDLKLAAVDKHLRRARELQRAGDIAAAQREATKSKLVKNTLAVAYHNLGNAYLMSDQHLPAMEQYKKALDLEPNMVKALTNLGVCFIGVGKASEAIPYLSRAAELSPGYFEAQHNLGFALRVSGDRKGAERHFQKARRLRPDVPLPEFPPDKAPPNPAGTSQERGYGVNP